MPFPQSFLDELMARSDIVDVVGSYVQLTRKGANLFGLCPFHSEKTGSFSVSPDKQIYYCFGCKRGGGVINFIMEEENLSFPDIQIDVVVGHYWTKGLGDAAHPDCVVTFQSCHPFPASRTRRESGS